MTLKLTPVATPSSAVLNGFDFCSFASWAVGLIGRHLAKFRGVLLLLPLKEDPPLRSDQTKWSILGSSVPCTYFLRPGSHHYLPT